MQIKVLQLISSSGLFGAERVVMELLKEFYNEKLKPFFGIVENRTNAHLIVAKEAKKYISNIQIFPCDGKLDVKTILSLRRFLKVNKINLIHSHGYKANFYSLIASRAKNIPLITTCHNWLSVNYTMRMYEWLDKKILNKFDRVIAVSDEIKERIAKSGIHPSRVVKIKNGINIEKYSCQNARKNIRAELGINNDIFVVGSIGRLDNKKGIDSLLKVAHLFKNDFKNIIFLIVGDGPAMQELSNESEELGITDSVIFTGFRNDIPSILSAIDIFVLPSLMEGLPMVLLEAMASKKPIIATRVGDIPIVIAHNESGLLVEPGNTDQLKDAISLLIKDWNLSNLIAEKGLEVVKNEYSSRQMARSYMELYNDVLQARV